MKKQFIFYSFFILGLFCKSQNWTLKLSSKIELRTWRLSSTAEKTEKSLKGATITLFKDKTQIQQTFSDGEGNFVINIPAKGDYILTIAYSACNTKKFYVTTNGVPDDVGKGNYLPSINITGFIMSNPLKGVDYLGLNEPLVKVEYKSDGQNFDKDEAVTNKGIEIVSKIFDAENSIIEKFCAANKAGDAALKKKNCVLAKECYLKAINLLPGEQYPIDQKEKAEQCVNDKKIKQETDAQLKAEQTQIAKTENDKAIAKKKEKDIASFTKNTASTTTINATTSNNSSTEKVNSSNGSGGDSKYSTPHKFGVDTYKEAIKKGDSYFKSKRYTEAKVAYEDALKQKPNDACAVTKITDCEKNIK